jgi:hypothetical protein
VAVVAAAVAATVLVGPASEREAAAWAPVPGATAGVASSPAPAPAVPSTAPEPAYRAAPDAAAAAP